LFLDLENHQGFGVPERETEKGRIRSGECKCREFKTENGHEKAREQNRQAEAPLCPKRYVM